MFECENPNIQKQSKQPNFSGGLCGVPYRILRKQAVDVQLSLRPNVIDTSESKASEEISIEKTNSRINPDSNNNDNLLWVEKFRPRNFLELLSDDGTNRTLLRWLKLWDKVVFNKEIKLKKAQTEQSDTNVTSEHIPKASPTEVIKTMQLI